MRKVRISEVVWDKLDALVDHMVNEFKLSEEAAVHRIDRLLDFLFSLGSPADYALCRFERWRELGYRCAVFEKNWVFAYEIINDGVLVRDMSHTTALTE